MKVLIDDNSGFCFGVVRAISRAEEALAARFGYVFVDTGAMYRAVTLFALENGAIRSGIVDEEALVALLPKIDIVFRFNPARGASDTLSPLAVSSS